MKKQSKIFALLCALCLGLGTLFVGCSEGKKDGFDNEKSSSKKEQSGIEKEDKDWTKNY